MPTHQLTTELEVSGMTCGNCARHVTEAIQSVPGVHSATVSLDSRSASVRWAADGSHDAMAVIEAIEKEGYRAKVVEAREHRPDEHALAGWHINLVIAVLGTVPLVIGEWVFGLGMMRWFNWFSFALAGIVQVFAGAQFYRGAWNQLKVRSANMDTLVALGSTTAFAYSVWALFTGYSGHLYFMEAAAIITLISVGHWIESRVTVRASDALRKLLNLAPQTARRLSFPGSSQCENSQKSVAHIELGNRHTNSGAGISPVSSYSHGRDARATTQIREEAPFSGECASQQALASATEQEVPVTDLNVGDLIALRPGDAVPTDGKVVDGISAVDESMLTGESAPVDKIVDSQLYAGTANLNGRLIMRVTATGEETALAHIIASVQRAQNSRANIQRIGDRVSGVFVPVIVSIAIAAGLWWGLAPESVSRVHGWLAQFLWHAQPPLGIAAGFIIAAAVLIIACPCAMGLATPAAIMAGSNAAASRGILVRDGVALEKAGKITAVIFDKTGTLTEGRPKVVARLMFSIAPELERIGIENLAASLAALSSHPLSKALAGISQSRVPLEGFKEISGRGVAALVKSDFRLQLGSWRWLEEEKIDCEPARSFGEQWMNQGATVSGFAVNGRLVAVFALQDTLKLSAMDAVNRLRDSYRLYLISGDSSRTVRSIAGKLNIPEPNVFAEIRPEQKAEFVKKLQAQGERVAFIGDGINDAPALEQADLGVAVSRASDIAREAADIVLLNSDIEAVPEALGLARATLRTIKQNLFWAFFYNAIGVPLAALGFMSPILCAAAMGFSDLIVIGNAMRLRKWKMRER